MPTILTPVVSVFGQLRPNGFVEAVIILFDRAQVMLRQFRQLLHTAIMGRTLARGGVDSRPDQIARKPPSGTGAIHVSADAAWVDTVDI